MDEKSENTNEVKDAIGARKRQKLTLYVSGASEVWFMGLGG